jgi:hypothetical protein
MDFHNLHSFEETIFKLTIVALFLLGLSSVFPVSNYFSFMNNANAAEVTKSKVLPVAITQPMQRVIIVGKRLPKN